MTRITVQLKTLIIMLIFLGQKIFAFYLLNNVTLYIISLRKQRANVFAAVFFLHLLKLSGSTILHLKSKKVKIKPTMKNGIITEVKGSWISMTIFILSFFNFSIVYSEAGSDEATQDGTQLPYKDRLRFLRERLQRGEINMLAIPETFSLTQHHDVLQIYMEKDCEKLVAIVPVKRTINFIIPKTILVFLLIISLIIVTTFRVLQFFKVLQEEWTGFDVLQILFEMPVNAISRKSVDRKILIYVILSSLFYSIYFYSSFVEVKALINEAPFDTFKNIDESGLKIYIFEENYNEAFFNDNQYVQNIKRKVNNVTDILTCMAQLLKHRDRICLVFQGLANTFNLNHEFANRQKAKIAKPVFNCLERTYHFEKSCPFSTRFYKILRKVYESGIDQHLMKLDQETEFLRKKRKKEKDSDHFFSSQLILILVCGYMLSFIAFIVENKIKR